jgi:hypothetical protein
MLEVEGLASGSGGGCCWGEVELEGAEELGARGGDGRFYIGVRGFCVDEGARLSNDVEEGGARSCRAQAACDNGGLIKERELLVVFGLADDSAVGDGVPVVDLDIAEEVQHSAGFDLGGVTRVRGRRESAGERCRAEERRESGADA